MKKNIRIIIICCIAAVVLAGLLILLKATVPEKEEEDTAAEDEVTSLLLYDKDPLTLAKLTVENEHGSYEVTRFGEGEEAFWAVIEFANLPIDGTVISSLIENASSVTSRQTVAENAENVSIYGFDAPSAVVTAEFSDSAGTVKKLLFGNLVPTGRQRYLMIEGDPNVYTVYKSSADCYMNKKYDVLSRTVYTPKSSDGNAADSSQISKITIKRPELDYDFIIEYDIRLDDESLMIANSSSHVVTSPIFRELNPEKASPVVDSIFGLAASDLAIVNPNENDFVALGLDEPAADIVFEIGSDTVHITVGNEYFDDDGKKAGRFVFVEGISIIYIFTEDTLPWLDVMPLDIVTTMITSNYIYELETFDIAAAGSDMHFTVTGSDAKTFAVKLDGIDADADAFKTLYQYILRAPSDELYFEDTNAEPAVKVTIKNINGKTDVIEFIPSESRKAIIRLNGKTSYKCAAAYVDRLLKNLELYKNGEDIVTNW